MKSHTNLHMLFHDTSHWPEIIKQISKMVKFEGISEPQDIHCKHSQSLFYYFIQFHYRKNDTSLNKQILSSIYGYYCRNYQKVQKQTPRVPYWRGGSLWGSRREEFVTRSPIVWAPLWVLRLQVLHPPCGDTLTPWR